MIQREYVLTSVVVAVIVVAGAWAVEKYLLSDKMLIPPDVVTPKPPPQAPLENAGLIYVDSPEVYTRERLVNDRYQQDAWLLGRLERTDDLDFGIQGVRDVRAATNTIAQARLGIVLSPGAPDTAIVKPKPTLPTLGNDDDTADGSGNTNREPTVTEGQAADNRSPIDDHRDRIAYRDEVRSAIIENQLDDRHDLDGNTLYRLKFDATVVPSQNNRYWGKIEVKLRPTISQLRISNYRKSWSMTDRAAYLHNNWSKDSPSDVVLWHTIFTKYLDALSQTTSSQLETRVAALRSIIELRIPFSGVAIQTERDIDELLRRVDDLVEDAVQEVNDSLRTADDEDKGTDGASGSIHLGDLQTRCGKKVDQGLSLVSLDPTARTSQLKYASCMITRAAELLSAAQHYGNISSRSRIIDSLIATALWQDVRASASKSVRRNSSSSLYPESSPPIQRLRRSNDLQSLVRALPHETRIELFALDQSANEEHASLRPAEEHGFGFLICKENHPQIFEEIDVRLKPFGLSINDPRLFTSPIFKLESYRIDTDSESGLLQCFDEELYLSRSDGLITFLESFMDVERPPAYTYAITPKEAVQRLSDIHDRAQASSAMAAIGIVAAALDAEGSLAALKELRAGFSGIGRHPLVVGYSESAFSPDLEGSEYDLVFGWVIAPRFHPGQDGEDPSFRQVLTQQALSALVSVPAWWPSLHLEVTTYWSDMKTGEPHLISQQRYPDVRLPGDLYEIQRILYPVLDKAPKIDRDSMNEVVVRAADSSEDNAGTSDKALRIVIPGQNLWRSTVVTLGAQRAQEIWVMPNMGGIVAQFRRTPLTHRRVARYIPLRVWTSEGMDIARNKICILPHDAPSEQDCQSERPRDRRFNPPRPEEVAEIGTIEEPWQSASRPYDSDQEYFVARNQSAVEPAESTVQQSTDHISAVAESRSQEIVAEDLLAKLGNQIEDARKALADVEQDESDKARTDATSELKGTTQVLKQTAQALASVAHANSTVEQVVETATAAEQALKSATDSEETELQNETVQDLKRRFSELTAKLQVLDIESRKAELDRSLAGILLQAESNLGEAAVQENGHAAFDLQILGLMDMRGRDLELRAGLVPESLHEEFWRSASITIGNWEEDLNNGALHLTDVKLPVLDSIENGSFVSVALLIEDRKTGYSGVVRSSPHVFYVDQRRASVRAEGSEILLNRDGMDGIFSVTLPARILQAFPESGSSRIVARATLMKDGVEVELTPEIVPISDLGFHQLYLQEEPTVNMALDFSGTDPAILEEQFNAGMSLEIDLVFVGDQNVDNPTIEGQLTVAGFEEPISKK